LILAIQKFLLILVLLFNLDIDYIILLFNNAIILNKFVLYIDFLILAVSCSYLIFIKEILNSIRIFSIEIYFFLGFSIMGFLILLKCLNMIVFFISFELQTFCLYALSLTKKRSLFSNEAGLKYFLTGALISSFFILGLSFFYGFYGNLNLIELKVLTENKNYFFNFFNLFFLITLFYKLGFFPFGQ
jgi:NADH-quinone oxidoreductase subunit N